MMDLYEELRRVIAALDDAAVTYAVAGGLAVSIYTAPRATEDIDVLVPAEDVERAVRAAKPLGFEPADRRRRVAGGRLEIQRLVKVAGNDLLPLDLLVPVDPTLRHVVDGRTSVSWEGRPIWVVGLASLRELKRLGRARPGSRGPRVAGPRRGMIHSDVSAVLRAVSALRALCLGLPHLPTPAEAEQLRRFDALAASPGSATQRDRDALATGWRRWWRTGQLDRLREMVKSLRPELVEGDRELSSYARAAELRQLGAQGRRPTTTRKCARPAGRMPTV